MKHVKFAWASWVIPPLVVMIILISGTISLAQAEQTGGLTPAGKILMDLLGATIGSSSSYAPIKLQAECSHEIGECWEARGLNKNNQDQVNDACWKEAKKCPKVCKDEYFSRRKAGMSSAMADPLFRGRRGEDTSCIPGVDKRTHPTGKVKANDSVVRVAVTIGGQPAKAEVTAIPVDAQGNEEKRTTSSPNYSKGNAYNKLFAPILLYLPAGRYRLTVLSPDRFYHRDRAFPKQTELITVKTGQTLNKVFAFGQGRLVVKAQDKDGSPVAATVEFKRSDFRQYVSFTERVPLDRPLLAGKYRLVVTQSKTRRKKAFDIEIKAGNTVTKTITFMAETSR